MRIYSKYFLGLEVMKRNLHELWELSRGGGGANQSETPIFPDEDTSKEFDEDMAERADATGRMAAANADKDVPPYEDSEEQETPITTPLPASNSTLQRVTLVEDMFLYSAAMTPLPDNDPI